MIHLIILQPPTSPPLPYTTLFRSLIDGPQAPMTGVFDGYEKQLLHDWISAQNVTRQAPPKRRNFRRYRKRSTTNYRRSEEHTSELQSRGQLVCRLLLEKKKHIQ